MRPFDTTEQSRRIQRSPNLVKNEDRHANKFMCVPFQQARREMSKKKRVVRGLDAARNSTLLMLRIMSRSAATRFSEDPLMVHACG
ncbi:unnamed protein product [Urochloa humidicola]